MLNLKGETVIGIIKTFKMFLNDKVNFSFFSKRVISEILWKIDKKAEKRFDETSKIDSNKALEQRLHGVDTKCFIKARVHAVTKVGHLNSCNFKLTVEYYFYYLTHLYKLLFAERVNNQLQLIFLYL